MLAGKPPFDVTKDTLSLVHAHLAKVPPDMSQHRKDLHPSITPILNKLLHKDPGQRYQSAKGLRHDLSRCLEQVQHGTATTFALGEKDIGATFELSDNIPCHVTEKEALLSTLDRVSTNGSEIVLVTGSSGIGKTTLVRSIQEAARRYHIN